LQVATAHTPAIGRNAVRAWHEADDLDRLQGDSPRIDRIGPDIADNLGDKRKDVAVVVERQLSVDDLVEAVTGGGEILQPVAHPAHSPTEVTGEHRNHDFLVIHRGLAAKTAADIRRDDPHAVSRHPEDVGQKIADDARDLRRQGQSQGPASLMVFGNARPVLDGNRRLAMKAKATADPNGGRSDFRCGITADKLAHCEHVGSRLLVQQRRIPAERRLGVGHGGEQFVGDLDPVAGVLGDVSVLGQDGGDWLPHVADLLARQRVEGCRVIILQPRRHAYRLHQILQIPRGVDAEHTRHPGGRLGADVRDQGVRVIAAAECDMQSAHDSAIGREHALPGQQPPILNSLDTRADIPRPQLLEHPP
jgi:hypothetical protein